MSAEFMFVYEPATDGAYGIMRPVRRFMAECDKAFCYGETYVLSVTETSQSARDRFYFAKIREAWANLPEQYDGQFPDADQFRKWLLVATGYCTKIRSPFPSEEEARAAVPLIMALRTDFCQVEAEGDVVVVTLPLSQKLSEAKGGMTADRRQASYRDTEDLAAEMVGISRRQLEREAGQSA